MLSFFKWIFNKDLNSYLNETKRIKVNGVNLIIKRINTINYLEGAKVLKQTYDVYKTKSAESNLPVSDKKIIEHFSHVLVSGVVSPKLSYTDDGNGLFVEKLFVDWDMVVSIYNSILEFTYGKKKMKQLMSLGKE
jgi:hypothetical protein